MKASISVDSQRRGRQAEWQLCCLHDCVRLHQDIKSFSTAHFPELCEVLDHPLMLQITEILSQKL